MATKSCPRCGSPLSAEGASAELDGCCPACLAKTTLEHLLEESEENRPLDIGQEFRDYEILGTLGRGGMGIVYKARQRSLDRIVALKILSPILAFSPEICRRFEAEARRLASLNHPNIVQVHAFGKEGDRLFLTMEFVEGASLEDRLKRRPPLELDEFLTILRDVAVGLERIHAAGLVHRDIKPANILLDREGTAKISDFGLAVDPDAPTRFTQTGAFIGSPHYASPEHVEASRLDGRADLYAVGVILFEGVTGVRPFDGESAGAILSRQLKEPPPLDRMAGLAPRRVSRITAKLLAKRKEDRTDSAKVLREELEAAIPEARHYRPGGFLPTMWARTVDRLRYLLSSPKGRIVAAAALIVVVLTAVAGVVLVSEWERAERIGRVRDIVAGARRDYDSGEYEAAEARAREALDLRAGSEDAEFLLARIAARRYMERRGIPMVFIHQYGFELIPLPPEPADLQEQRAEAEKRLGSRPLGLGLLALWKEDHDGALERFLEVPDDAPEAKDAALYSAVALYHQERFGEAREILGRLESGRAGLALRLTVNVHAALGRKYYLLRQIQHAADRLNEAVSICEVSADPLGRVLHAWLLLEWLRMTSARAEGSPQLNELERSMAEVEGPEAELIRARFLMFRVQNGIVPAEEKILGKIEETYTRAVDLDPGRALTLFFRADMWSWRAQVHPGPASQRRRFWEKAERDYRAAFVLHPRMPLAAIHAEMASLSASFADPDATRESLRTMEDLARRFPEYPRIRLVLAGMHAGGGSEDDLKAAVADLEEAVELRPDMIEAHLYLGMAYRRMGDFLMNRRRDPVEWVHRAIRSFDRVIELAPRVAEPFEGRGRARHLLADHRFLSKEDPTKDYRRALEDYTEAIDRDVTKAEYFRRRGNIRVTLTRYRELNHRDPPGTAYTEAIEDLTRAIEMEPQNDGIYRDRASARNYQAMSAPDVETQIALWNDAVADITQALELDPRQVASYSTRAVLLTNIGAQLGSEGRPYLERAIQDYDKVVQARPRSPTDRLNRGKCLSRLGRKKEAAADLKRAAEIDPSLRAEVDYWLRKNEGNP